MARLIAPTEQLAELLRENAESILQESDWAVFLVMPVEGKDPEWRIRIVHVTENEWGNPIRWKTEGDREIARYANTIDMDAVMMNLASLMLGQTPQEMQWPNWLVMAGTIQAARDTGTSKLWEYRLRLNMEPTEDELNK